MRLLRILSSALLAAALLGGPPVQAKKPDDERPSRHERWQRDDRREAHEERYRERGPRYDERHEYEPRYERSPRRSLSDAVSEAERRTGGQALSAEPRMDGGRTHYRVKVLTPDGRVQILYMDAD